MDEKKYTCPICKSNKLFLKHEASFVYSYKLDADAPGTKNSQTFSPYLYDRREQTASSEYLECDDCKTRFSGDMLHKFLY